ncbi:hypothetical protein BC826DRAFT_1048611, partial [Russula brevipes]
MIPALGGSFLFPVPAPRSASGQLRAPSPARSPALRDTAIRATCPALPSSVSQSQDTRPSHPYRAPQLPYRRKRVEKKKGKANKQDEEWRDRSQNKTEDKI